MKKDLLEYCYKYQKEYVYDTSQREFDCLLELVESDSVSSFKEKSIFPISG